MYTTSGWLYVTESPTARWWKRWQFYLSQTSVESLSAYLVD